MRPWAFFLTVSFHPCNSSTVVTVIPAGKVSSTLVVGICFSVGTRIVYF